MRLASYDLFDTLITRVTRRPVDIFRLLDASESVKFRWKVIGIIPFHVWRRQAERLARRLSKREDIKLVDIYRVLGWVICSPSRVMRLEVALEIAAIGPIPHAVEPLLKQHNEKIPCCIVSDMYLPRSTIRKIVRQHIGDIPFYVSSDIGLTKTTGRLFQHVANAHGVPIAEIHHCGDNPVADHAVPLRMGIQASLVAAEQQNPSICMLDVLKPHQSGDSFYDMGFRLAGPSAFVMAACLARYVDKNPPTNLIFAARDMHLVQYAFERISSYKETSYCRISRSAVYHAQWHANRDPECWFEDTATGADFFRRLGIPCPPDLAELVPLSHRQRFTNALTNSDFSQTCEAEYQTVRDYLQSEGFQTGSLFVDLGWRGSIQDAINQILSPEKPIKGWYFGTNKSHPHKQGLYFNGNRPFGRCYKVLQAISFFEFLFTEPVPSLSRVARNRDVFEFISTQDEDPNQIASRIRVAEGARAYIDTITALHRVTRFKDAELLQSLDQLYGHYLFAPPHCWVSALDTATHSAGFGGSNIISLVGDNTGNPLGLLRSPWKGGYMIKHEKSRWAPALKRLNNPVAFLMYENLKRGTRPLRSITNRM